MHSQCGRFPHKFCTFEHKSKPLSGIKFCTFEFDCKMELCYNSDGVPLFSNSSNCSEAVSNNCECVYYTNNNLSQRSPIKNVILIAIGHKLLESMQLELELLLHCPACKHALSPREGHPLQQKRIFPQESSNGLQLLMSLSVAATWNPWQCNILTSFLRCLQQN